MQEERSPISEEPNREGTAEDAELVESGRRRLEPSRSFFGFCSCEALACTAPAQVAFAAET